MNTNGKIPVLLSCLLSLTVIMIILPSAVESIKYFLLNLSWSVQKKESDSVVLAKIIIRESHVRDYCPCLPTKVS